ncbi:hypothetical protein [Plesiocystis pacifica]|uniref:hypothetical protein n=1 Tax=Plesiocystis pacifica TaxID=191768 RepID=UPI0018DC0BC3|nr:hypothetical protein [Plesiocystis pacifica]
MPRRLAGARRQMQNIGAGTIWPGTYPQLENSIMALCDRTLAYLDHFRKNAVDSGKGYYHEDKWWAEQAWDSDVYDDALHESRKWQLESFYRFVILARTLDQFSEHVRLSVSKKYFLVEGLFLVRERTDRDQICRLSLESAQEALKSITAETK